jgi:hypothetical protein
MAGQGPGRSARPRLPAGAYWVNGPDHRDNPRRDPRHLACRHGRGRIFATFKMFLIIGLIAMAVFSVVWLVARRPRRG